MRECLVGETREGRQKHIATLKFIVLEILAWNRTVNEATPLRPSLQKKRRIGFEWPEASGDPENYGVGHLFCLL
jgi:hypothetical protein